MLWSDLDEHTIGQCRQAMENCRRYNTRPAPWFELCMRMHQTLAEYGLLERVALDRAVCEGCVDAAEGGCRRNFSGAAISSKERRVAFCRNKITEKQLEARREAAARRRKRGTVPGA